MIGGLSAAGDHRPGVRPATGADVSGMARLLAAGWGDEAYWSERVELYRTCRAHPKEALLPRSLFVVPAAEDDDGRLLGVVAGHRTRRFGCDGELQWLHVVAERRRGGLASRLLCRLAAWFVENGAARICVDVEPANLGARLFYARHGAISLNAHWLVWNDIPQVLLGPGSETSP
jgi:GNAT superfamily N-acetyltransferase